MKITKAQLKQIIKEEMNDIAEVESWIPGKDMSRAAVAARNRSDSSPEMDIENALDLLKDPGPGTTFQVIEALQAAIEKLEGQEEPRDPYADESPYDAGY